MKIPHLLIAVFLSTMMFTSTNIVLAQHMSVIFIQSPLKQFQSGISSQHIQCNDGLELIFKSSNGSPACVKHDTAMKLVKRGWEIISNLALTNNVSENNCGQFSRAPGSLRPDTMPVLLIDLNSTSCARLTFTIVHNPGTTLSSLNITSGLLIGNYNVTKHVNLLSVVPGKDYTHSFQTTVVPKIIDLSNFPTDSNFTVTYMIKPLPNATGFYDYSIPRLLCSSYPLAVGYTADQVNYSDFSYINQQIHSCALGPYHLTAVEISGMHFKDISLSQDTSNK